MSNSNNVQLNNSYYYSMQVRYYYANSYFGVYGHAWNENLK